MSLTAWSVAAAVAAAAAAAAAAVAAGPCSSTAVAGSGFAAWMMCLATVVHRVSGFRV